MRAHAKVTGPINGTQRGPCLLWLLALAAAILWSQDAAAVTVHLGPQDAVSTVVLHVGDRLRVELPTAPQTGFRWKAKMVDASHLEALGQTIRPDSTRLDAAGTQVFVWKALSPGQASASLTYSRPADGKTVPAEKRVAIRVEVVEDALAPPASAGAAPEWQLAATYRGTLPCDDCTGIAVDLALYALSKEGSDAADPMLFVERRRYQGAPGGDRTIAGTGRLTVQQGTYADAASRVYTLDAPDGSTENFRVDGDRLTPLDAQMLPLPPPRGRDIALHRSTGEQSDASGP